jgi:hypothetical protein
LVIWEAGVRIPGTSPCNSKSLSGDAGMADRGGRRKVTRQKAPERTRKEVAAKESQATVDAPRTFTPERLALCRAFLAALRDLEGDRNKEPIPALLAKPEPQGQQGPPSTGTSHDRKPPPEHYKVDAEEIVRPFIVQAVDDADSLGRIIHDWAEHFEVIGCQPSEVLGYLRLSEQVLARLYLFAAAPGNPSPTELRRWAFRYALDARESVEGDLRRFALDRSPKGWTFTEFTTCYQQIAGLPRPVKRVIRNPSVLGIVDCVLTDPLSSVKLMLMIEQILKRVPQQGDALPLPGQSVFCYELSPGPGGGSSVRLWIDNREVSLHRWEGARKILVELCGNPEGKFNGGELERRLDISNASQSVSKIRKALEEAQPGAERWLLSDPICWADGHAPCKRQPTPARGGGGTKK